LKQKNESYKSGVCRLTQKSIPLDVLTLKLLEMEDKRLKKIFISYSRKDVKYKDELESHLSLLKRYDLIKTWTCEEIKVGTWHKQIQKELEEADIIVYMISHHFLDSDYIMDQEVKKGIDLVKKDKDKKILCVLVGACQWKNLSEFNDIDNSLEDVNNKYSGMDRLTQYQFLPYHQYKNDQGKTEREELIPIEKWGRNHYDVVNEAYNQIAEKILQVVK
jgi:internalin A